MNDSQLLKTAVLGFCLAGNVSAAPLDGLLNDPDIRNFVQGLANNPNVQNLAQNFVQNMANNPNMDPDVRNVVQGVLGGGVNLNLGDALDFAQDFNRLSASSAAINQAASWRERLKARMGLCKNVGTTAWHGMRTAYKNPAAAKYLLSVAKDFATTMAWDRTPEAVKPWVSSAASGAAAAWGYTKYASAAVWNYPEVVGLRSLAQRKVVRPTLRSIEDGREWLRNQVNVADDAADVDNNAGADAGDNAGAADNAGNGNNPAGAAGADDAAKKAFAEKIKQLVASPAFVRSAKIAGGTTGGLVVGAAAAYVADKYANDGRGAAWLRAKLAKDAAADDDADENDDLVFGSAAQEA